MSLLACCRAERSYTMTAIVVIIKQNDDRGSQKSTIMSSRQSMNRRRHVVEFGEHICSWRKASRLSADLVAERAGITRDTLRAIEVGSGSVRLENVFAVLEALGLDSNVVAAIDPINDERGRALVQRAVNGGAR